MNETQAQAALREAMDQAIAALPPDPDLDYECGKFATNKIVDFGHDAKNQDHAGTWAGIDIYDCYLNGEYVGPDFHAGIEGTTPEVLEAFGHVLIEAADTWRLHDANRTTTRTEVTA